MGTAPPNKRFAISPDRWALFAVVALCIAWVAVHAFLADAVTVRICEHADAGIPREKRLPVFLSEIAFDGYVWNRHAEHLGGRNGWRLRRTDFDNAPYGREVHWSSPFAWYLRGLGELRRAFTGEPLRHAIFRMSIWANPLLLMVALAVIPIVAARRFGSLAGAVVAAGMVATPSFYEGFLPAYPDHHGIIALSHLGLLLGAAWAGAGWVRKNESAGFLPAPSFETARRGMIASALCGAAGLWLSALATAMVIAVVGVGAVVSAVLFARPRMNDGASEYFPGLWKTWALWGAGGSVALYLFEYFPNHMGLRLEVNHPLYALAWLGGGWDIALLAEWIAQKRRAHAVPLWRRMIWPTLAALVLPAFLAFGSADLYIPKDGFMLRLWQNIAELQPLIRRIALGQINWLTALGWFPMFLLAALFLLFCRRLTAGAKGALVLLAVPIVLLNGLQFYQSRWGLLVGPLYIALAALAISQLWRLLPRQFAERALAVLLAMPLGYLLMAPAFGASFKILWNQYRGGDPIQITPGQALAILHRQMARAISDDAGERPVVLLSSPNSSCMLAALGGFQTVGTLYWENVEGLKAAAAALNAQNEGETFALLRQRGITHLSFMTWENFIEPYFQILHPKSPPGVSFSNSFGRMAFFEKRIPPWTRPLVFPPNDIARGLNQQILLLRVAPEQSLAEAQYHLARFVRVVEGAPGPARELFQKVLDSRPPEPLARLARVELTASRVSEGEAGPAIEELIEALNRVPPEAREAPLEETARRLVETGRWADLTHLWRGVAAAPDAKATTLLNAAWNLATAPEHGDPALSLAICDRAAALGHDPDRTKLVRAAALAARGDFGNALGLVTEVALSRSAERELRSRAEAMRAVFASGKPWLAAAPRTSNTERPPPR